MVIHEAAENYLETIFMLLRRKGSCRSVDVSREMGYSKPTISVMMRNLRENGYISMDDGGFITLTDRGMEIASHMYERHETIAKVLMKLGVDAETAYEDSCKIEHDLSDTSFNAIRKFLDENDVL
ncbi:MAG: metal-dependent transcriptional regulator [Ruminococcaceae bacterium]|nr:metal-dependent transcriptional regulator [Oscillospiraceae bacterium]